MPKPRVPEGREMVGRRLGSGLANLPSSFGVGKLQRSTTLQKHLAPNCGDSVT